MHSLDTLSGMTFLLGRPVVGGATDPRLSASVTRLLRPDYHPDRVFEMESGSDWPGDYPGRLILALANLAQFTDAVLNRLAHLITMLPAALNERGYLGPIHREFDEQQLAGHAWLVSGLLAHHRLTRDPESRRMAHRIIESLFLPLIGNLADYPVRRDDGGSDGAASGVIDRRQGDWLLSSDTYCIFIVLEGVVAGFADGSDPRVRTLIDEFLVLLDRDDLVSCRAQLHASMTAARSVLDYAVLTGSDAALNTARRLYQTYRRNGRTLNDATFNWFGRPDSWTEPCAMVDTFLLARGLWWATGNVEYLDDAHRIEINGLGHSQRPNGGFGLDSVTLPDQPWLTTAEYEATWCCTMRGAIGLVEARIGGVRFGPVGTNRLNIDFFHSMQIQDPSGAVELLMATDYPNNGTVVLTATRTPEGRPVQVEFHVPPWVGPEQLSIDTIASTSHRSITFELFEKRVVTVTIPMLERRETDGTVRSFRGPQLLCSDDRPSRTALLPVDDIFSQTEAEAKKFRARITAAPGFPKP